MLGNPSGEISSGLCVTEVLYDNWKQGVRANTCSQATTRPMNLLCFTGRTCVRAIVNFGPMRAGAKWLVNGGCFVVQVDHFGL